MKSKYIITVHNKSSPEYGTSLYHYGIGTGTIICYDKNTAILALEKHIIMYKNIDYATIESFDSSGESLGFCTWYRSRNGLSAQNLLQYLH